MKIRRFLSMIEERHIRLGITLIVVLALGFLVNFFVRENDKAEKRRREWQLGCKGGLGKLHSGLSTVSVFYSEELIEELGQQNMLSLMGDEYYQDTPDLLARLRQNRPAFRKQLDEGKVYFSVKNDTPVRFLGKSQQGVPKIHVSVMEGHYLGNSGWIDPDQYWCLDW